MERTGVPNVVGAIDGKHIEIRQPNNSVAMYRNYKGYFSIVLLAACDVDCVFTLVDIGAYGSQSDGGVFRRTWFGERLLEGRLDIPPPKPLPGTNTTLPHFFIGDAAFPLHESIMRPYPDKSLLPDEHIMNKRISGARSSIERSFGMCDFVMRKLVK